MKKYYDEITYAGKLKKKSVSCMNESDGSTPFDKVGYLANLQQAIEYHCRGQVIPDALSKLCPHHSKMLNMNLLNEMK